MEFDPDSFNQNDALLKNNLGQRNFLRLMAAQIQSQNSMPSETEEGFLSQLTQSDSNNGLAKMLESLQQMTTFLQSNQALQASALVGRKVLVHCNSFVLHTESDVKVVVDLPVGMSHLNAFFYSESGELIKTILLNHSASGLYQMNWDGTGEDNSRVKEGKYRVEICAFYVDRKVSLQTMIFSNVDSVSLGPNGGSLTLNVAGIGPVSLDKVKQILV